MSDIVTTNLRISRSEWLKLKSMAAELGLSANEYILLLIRSLSGKRQLGIQSSSEQCPIWKLSDLAKGKAKGLGLSKEDSEIYE